jgi:hypothetical protein
MAILAAAHGLDHCVAPQIGCNARIPGAMPAIVKTIAGLLLNFAFCLNS